MAEYLVTDTDLTSVANAIRTKGGTSTNLEFPSGFVTAIGSLSSSSSYDFRGANIKQVTSTNFQDVNYTLSDTSLSTTNVTTSTKTIYGETQIPSSTFYTDGTKDFYLHQLQIIDLAYNEEVYPRMLYLVKICHVFIGGRPDSITGMINNTKERIYYKTITNNIKVYKNNSNVETTVIDSAATAINMNDTTINLANPTNPTGYGFKIRIPALTARIDNGIMEESAYQALDYANSKIHVETKLYYVDIGNLFTASYLDLANNYQNFITAKQSQNS